MEQSVLQFAIAKDWPVLIPLVIASIFMLGAAIDRFWFYQKNRRDIYTFRKHLHRALQRGDLDNAQAISEQLGGLIGIVAQEGVHTLRTQQEEVEIAFDIHVDIARRELERRLWVIATVATISPYLGLFATVWRILLTFGELSQSQSANAAPEVMLGIGSALIATAFGLMIAIVAVVLNNWFQTQVSRYEEDFQSLKRLFIYAAEADATPQASAAAPSMR